MIGEIRTAATDARGIITAAHRCRNSGIPPVATANLAASLSSTLYGMQGCCGAVQRNHDPLDGVPVGAQLDDLVAPAGPTAS
jgi:hypothetical protein